MAIFRHTQLQTLLVHVCTIWRVTCMSLKLLPESEGLCALTAVRVHVAVCGPSLHAEGITGCHGHN